MTLTSDLLTSKSTKFIFAPNYIWEFSEIPTSGL